MLVQHAANALSRSAAHLPFNYSRIDHRAAVLDDEIARNVYLARLRVDLDPAAMGGLCPPTLATVIGKRTNKLEWRSRRQVTGREVDQHGDLCERNRFLRHAAHRDHAIRNLKIIGTRLKHRSGNLKHLLFDLAAREQCPAARDRLRPAAVPAL